MECTSFGRGILQGRKSTAWYACMENGALGSISGMHLYRSGVFDNHNGWLLGMEGLATALQLYAGGLPLLFDTSSGRRGGV